MDTLKRHRDRPDFEAQSPNWVDHGLVFPNIYGTPYDPANVLARFKRPLAAGLPDQRLRDLRHYIAPFSVGKGVPMCSNGDLGALADGDDLGNLHSCHAPAHREVADLIDQTLRPKTQETAIPEG